MRTWLLVAAIGCNSSNHGVVDGASDSASDGASDGEAANDASYDAPIPLLDAYVPALPVVAWHDNVTGNFEIYARQWNGTVWAGLGGSESAGGISNTVGDSEVPSVVLGSDELPIVAWSEYVGSISQLYLKRWNGTSWQEIGGSATDLGVSQINGVTTGAQLPSLAIDHHGRIVVAWQQTNTAGRLISCLRRWNGSVWEELAGSASGNCLGSDASAPSIAIDVFDRIVIAWSQSGPSICDVYVKRWTGTTWEALGNSATGNGISGTQNTGRPNVLIGTDGNPLIAWPTDFTLFDVARWDGVAWQRLGTPAANNLCGTPKPGFTLDPAGQLVLRVATSGATFRWDGTAWQPRPAPSGRYSESLARDGDGLIAAWPEPLGSNQFDIYVQRWDGSQWLPLNHLNVSNTPTGISDFPSIASR
ncbi:MAG: exported protein of unknown function [Myxococcales bacterium]|nr:exported protein of unknown function [Myxococcales bacterium]